MTGAAHGGISAEHRRIVLDILRTHVPRDAQVWVFGSRATGRARPYSDLDLLIDAGRRLTFDDHAMLREAFSESDLPYKVDMVDRRAITEAFHARIAGHCVRLLPDDTAPPAKPPGASGRCAGTGEAPHAGPGEPAGDR
jgi:predicted nucleotidyltransferase